MKKKDVDIILISCEYCNKMIKTYWNKRTGDRYHTPDTKNIADMIYHVKCYDLADPKIVGFKIGDKNVTQEEFMNAIINVGTGAHHGK